MKYSAMKFVLPFCLFLMVTGFLWKSLSLDSKELPSVLVGKPSPEFMLTTVEDPNRIVTAKIFKGKITLLNVWATWCNSCKVEHAVWMDLVKQRKTLAPVFVIGLNYHDALSDAQNWLKTFGNPYQFVIFDELGRLGLEYGVYGTPETYILDKNGIIRYRHAGPITQDIWEQTILPVIEGLMGRHPYAASYKDKR